MENVKAEFKQVKDNIGKLQKQMETVDEEVKEQYKDFLEVRR